MPLPFYCLSIPMQIDVTWNLNSQFFCSLNSPQLRRHSYRHKTLSPSLSLIYVLCSFIIRCLIFLFMLFFREVKSWMNRDLILFYFSLCSRNKWSEWMEVSCWLNINERNKRRELFDRRYLIIDELLAYFIGWKKNFFIV